jgi:DNA-binding beta-propeller fold protein YncE
MATPATAAADGKLADQLWETPMDQEKVLAAPMGLALDPQGRIWVLDGADDHVQIFSADGEHLETWGEHGTGEGQFDLGGRGDIDFASNGSFYVTDTENRRVQQFAPDRSFVRTWSDAGNLSGTLASPATANMLLRPSSIDIAPDGSVYVSDDERNVIEHYSPDGVWLNTLGTDSGDGRLNAPGGMAFDQDGNLWVADYGRGRLAAFAPDGTFLRDVTGINLPTDVEFDNTGHLLVVDAKGLLVMNQDLQPVGRIWRDQGMFVFLPSVVSGADGRVYVADYNLAFLTAFQLRDPLPAPPTPTPAP